MSFSHGILSYLAVSLIGLMALTNVHADKLDQAVKIDMTTQQAAKKSQQRIDKLSEKTRQALNEFRSASQQTETLRTYNKYLQTLIDSQLSEKKSLQLQFEEIETTQKEIIPLILDMLSSLEKFIQLDLPFLPEERRQRLARLKEMVARADVTTAEKFRRIMEAYQIENDYGNSIEAYRDDLKLGGKNSSVDLLRLGRVALYYQRLDGSETGFWNKESKRWETLPDAYRNAIRKGLRIARKETAPDLLVLPVPAPEAAK